MKSILIMVIFFIVIVNSMHISTNSISLEFNGRFSQNAVIYQLFEMFRSLLKFGDSEKNIPIMDPFQFNMEGAQIHNLFDGEVNITNGMISGWSNFQLQDFSFIKDEMAINIVMKIPRVKFDAEYYELDGEILEAVPIAGSGILYFLVKDIKITTKLFLKQSDNGKSVTIEKLANTSFSIENILSRTEYSKNIDNVLNAMTEDLLAGYLTRFSKYIAKTTENDIVKLLNSLINGYDTWSILATILH